MDEPRARSASRLADLPAGVELGEYYSRQVEARPFILHPGSRLACRGADCAALSCTSSPS